MSKPPPKVINVLIEELIYDPENANKMEEREYRQLVTNIKQIGAMLQPICVKEVPEGFKVVDGEHRARASKEAGLDSVLAVVWDGTEEMRKALALSFNKIHGELDLTQVQKIVSDLHTSGWTVNEISMTGYSTVEIEDLLQVDTSINPDDVMENPIAAPSTSAAEAPPRPLSIDLTFANQAELKFAKKGLRKAAGKGRELGEGLLTLLGYEPKE